MLATIITLLRTTTMYTLWTAMQSSAQIRLGYHTLWSKKTAPFYFCNNSVKSFRIKIIIGMQILQWIWNKRTSKSQHSKHVHSRVNNQCHAITKVIIIISHIYRKHHIKYEMVRTSTAIVKHYIKCTKYPPLALMHALSLTRHWSTVVSTSHLSWCNFIGCQCNSVLSLSWQFWSTECWMAGIYSTWQMMSAGGIY